MTLNLRKLRSHPAYHKLVAVGTVAVGGAFLIVADEAVEGLKDLPVEKYARQAKSERTGVQWPVWALSIAAKRKDGERGVGDTAERLFGAFGGALFSVTMRAAGIDCGCSARKDSWNSLYPY